MWGGELRSTKMQESECPAGALSQNVQRKMASKILRPDHSALEFYAQPDVYAAEAGPQTGKIRKVTSPLTFLGNYLR